MNWKYTFGALVFLPTLPLLAYQGKKVRASVPKLPEAQGIEGLVAIEGNVAPVVRMLCIGESTMAGVGVATHEEGFVGTLAKELSAQIGRSIAWKVYARSGYTAKRVRYKILNKITEKEVDLLVVGLGGNDAFTLNSPKKWRADVKGLIEDLHLQFPDTPIFFTNMPPIKEFPAFTPLIKASVGNLVEILGKEMQIIVKRYEHVYYQHEVITIAAWNRRFGMRGTAADYFSDGVHPSKITYQVWAKDMALGIAATGFVGKGDR